MLDSTKANDQEEQKLLQASINQYKSSLVKSTEHRQIGHNRETYSFQIQVFDIINIKKIITSNRGLLRDTSFVRHTKLFWFSNITS